MSKINQTLGLLRNSGLGNVNPIFSRAVTTSLTNGQKVDSDNIRAILSEKFQDLKRREESNGVGLMNPADIRTRTFQALVTNIISPKNTLPDFGKGKERKYAGQAVFVDEEGYIKDASALEIKDSPAIFIPGLKYGGPGGIKETSKALKSRLGDNFLIFVPQKENGALISERYQEGTNYEIYHDNSVIIEDASLEFFEKILKPKFFDDLGNLKALEQCERTLLMAHSIGTRELRSHMRFFRRKLQADNIDDGTIQKYMDQILCLNFASPVILEPEEGPYPVSFSILGMNDIGSKRSEEFLLSFYCNKDCYLGEGFFNIDDAKKEIVVTMPELPMFVLNENNEIIMADDGWGHALCSYINALSKKEYKNVGSLVTYLEKFIDPKSQQSTEDFYEELSRKFDPNPIAKTFNSEEVDYALEAYASILESANAKVVLAKSELKKQQGPGKSPQPQNSGSHFEISDNDKTR